jgi:tetratricopeptide (TPR) repeat protein
LAYQAEQAISRNELPEAERLLRESERLDEDNPQTIAGWGAYHLAAGNTEEAVRYAELAARKRPRRAAYHVLVGDARRAAGDAGGARRAYERALEVDPDDRTARRRLGR